MSKASRNSRIGLRRAYSGRHRRDVSGSSWSRIPRRLNACRQLVARLVFSYCALTEEFDFLLQIQRLLPTYTASISYLTTIEDAHVLTTRNVTETAELMATMARHLTQGLGYLVNHRANKPKLIRRMQEFIAEGLPCVGPVAAKALMNHFGTIPALMQADVDQLCALPKIGMKTAKQIREVLDADYHQLE